MALVAALAWLLATFTFAPTMGLAAPISLPTDESAERVEFAASYMLLPQDEEITASEALSAYEQGRFSPEMAQNNGSAFHDWRHWIALPFVYPADSAVPQVRRVIGLGGIFVEPPRVFLTCKGAPLREILATHAGQGGQLETRYFTYLRTQSFAVSAGDNCLALINASSNDNPNLGIFREGELGSNQVVAVLLKGGVTATLLIIGLVLAIVSYLTDRPLAMLMGLAYSVTMLQNDASLFSTTFAANAQQGRAIWESLTLASVFMCYWTFLFAFRTEFKLVGNPWRSVAVAAIPTPLIWIAYASNSTPDLIWSLYLALILFVAALAMRFDVARTSRLLAGAIFTGCILGAVLVEPYYLGRFLTDLTIEFLRDVIRLAAGLAMLLLVLIDVQRTRFERNRMTAERIASLERQSKTDRKLLKAERDYARARDASTRRKAQLAAASHDMRQPIVGIKSALASEASNLSVPLRRRLDQAISYLEALTREYSHEDTQDDFEADTYSIDLVLRAVENMFAAEARDAGVALNVATTNVVTSIPALALIRTTSNLVANALRHAKATNIGVSLLTEGSTRITVTDDGIGMSESELANALLRNAKSPQSDGDGLGLAIAQELAEKHGFDFSVRSHPGEGTVATITLMD